MLEARFQTDCIKAYKHFSKQIPEQVPVKTRIARRQLVRRWEWECWDLISTFHTALVVFFPMSAGLCTMSLRTHQSWSYSILNMLEWKRVRHVYEDTVYIAYFDIHSIIQMLKRTLDAKSKKLHKSIRSCFVMTSFKSLHHNCFSLKKCLYFIYIYLGHLATNVKFLNKNYQCSYTFCHSIREKKSYTFFSFLIIQNWIISFNVLSMIDQVILKLCLVTLVKD
jgi:hypothetical protein